MFTDVRDSYGQRLFRFDPERDVIEILVKRSGADVPRTERCRKVLVDLSLYRSGKCLVLPDLSGTP